MRALCPVCGLIFLAFNAGCVSDDPIPAYVSIQYQLRCLQGCRGGVDSAARQVFHVDGEDGLVIQCSVSTDTSGQEVLSVVARCPGTAACGQNPYGIELNGIDIHSSSGDPGEGCRVSVTEGSNIYESRCTQEDLDESHRCLMTLLDVDPKSSEVTGNLRCVDIADPEAPDFTRYLVAPGGSATSEVKFFVQGCQGL